MTAGVTRGKKCSPHPGQVLRITSYNVCYTKLLRIGVLLQEARFPDRLTVREVVSLFRSFYPRGREVPSVIREVGLRNNFV